ncbi:MAG TPA: helix-turn-helix domain-containing protein, partial [Terriglobia bacterium]|nr:helix-turn-helix domain-containing protein [Terriglobia bacterium]
SSPAKPNGSGRKTYHSMLRSGWQPRYRSSQTMTNSLRELSHQLFVAALKQCHGNRSRAAVLLGLTRNKFYKLLKLHGLDGESSRNGPGESDWIQ